jgi:OTU domain-containing protein 6
LDSLWLLDADTKSNKKHDFISLRLLAGEYLKVHAEEFAPFLGLSPSDSEYEEYCRKVISVGDAEWGGQLEIKALCSCLNRTMLIFSADSPVLKMGDEEGKECSKIPLKLAYHRHFYALGEHYNSVAPVIKPCSCSIDEHTTH